MEMLILILILAVLACVVLLLIYVIEKVRHLESRTFSPGTAEDSGDPNRDPRFGGLEAIELWNLMCGKPVEGWKARDVDALRPRYGVVLGKHIEMIFQAGRNADKEPGTTATISTLRGGVASYLPANHVHKLYELGSRSIKEPLSAELYAALDATCEVLCTRTGVEIDQPFSTKILGPFQAQSLTDRLSPDETPPQAAPQSSDLPSDGDSPRNQ